MPIPLIAAAVSALAPTLAQKGLDILSAAFKGGITKGSEQVAALIEQKTGITVRDIAENRLDPAQWQKLAEFEAQNKSEILAAQVRFDTNDVERERVAASDRNSARVLQQAAMTTGDKASQWFQYFYTTLLTCLAFGFIFWAAFLHSYTDDPSSKDLINVILGFLFTVLTAVVSYHYGTTVGREASSKRKDDRAVYLTDIIASGKDKP
jgi:hypothetical protein